MQYIDSHAFVWSNDNLSYPITKDFTDLPAGKIEFSPPELLLRNGRPSSVDKFVLIQAPQYHSDNTYIIEQVTRFPEIFKAVVYVDPGSPKIQEEMTNFSRLGINAFRIITSTNLKPQFYKDYGYDLMFSEAEKNNHIISVLAYPDGFIQLKNISEVYPNLPVVIENIGNIFEEKNNFQKSLYDLCELSSAGNIFLKLSGFHRYSNNKLGLDELILTIEKLYSAFSPNRLMWGSDYPFQVLHETYEDSLSIIKNDCTFLSTEQKQQILSITARDLFFPY